MQGIIVTPGVIDADFEGDIKVMIPSPGGVVCTKGKSEAFTINFTFYCVNQ